MTTAAVATCPACRHTVKVRDTPSGTRRLARHDLPGPVGRSCPGTGREVKQRPPRTPESSPA